MSSVTHSSALTAEVVIAKYSNLLYEVIRSFHIERMSSVYSPEDAFQGIMFALLRKSDTLGTSYLERYDPDRAAPTTFLRMFAIQWMTKLRGRLVSETKASGKVAWGATQEAAPRVFGTDVQLEESLYVSDVLRLLDKPPYNVARSHAPNGDPRSTKRIVELILVHRLRINEVGRHLELSSNEVVRRIKRLRSEPAVVKLLEDAYREQSR